MSRMIVTGGAGFIGSHLSELLISSGHDVVVVDDLSSGFRENVPPGAKWIEGDLADADTCRQLGDGADVVFHLASHVGQELSFESPLRDLRSNILGTANLIAWSRAVGVGKFVFASTMNVYGDPDNPLNPVSEDSEMRPPSPYAVGKIASEHLLDVYRPMGIESAALRLFNVYGTRQDMSNMKQGMVSIFMSYVASGEPIEVRGSGERFRDFVHVSDVARAFVRCSECDAQGAYNVSTGVPTTVDTLLKQIIEAFDSDPDSYPVLYCDGTPRDQFGLCGDSTRLRSLGWEPRIELDLGVKEMADWVRGGQARFA